MEIVMHRAYHEVFIRCSEDSLPLLAKTNNAAVEITDARFNNKPFNASPFKHLCDHLEGDRHGDIDMEKKLWFGIYKQTPILGLHIGDERKLELLANIGNPDNHYDISRHLAQYITAYGTELNRAR